MRILRCTLASLLVLSVAVAAEESLQIDENGNRIETSQSETRIIEGDLGACEVDNLKLFDNGDRYRRGADDKVLVDDPDQLF